MRKWADENAPPRGEETRPIVRDTARNGRVALPASDLAEPNGMAVSPDGNKAR